MPKVIDTVRQIAPAIATGLAATGMPLGVIAGAMLTTALGLPRNAGEDDIVATITKADPTLLLQLRKADQDFELELRKAEVAEATVDAGDRASAREREVSLQGDMVNRLTMTFLAAFALALLTFIIWLVCKVTLPQAAENILFMLAGSVVGLVTQVFNYFFGSSSGSRQKSDALNTLAATSKK